MKVALLFTPFASPTYVPLGLACLKGSLAREGEHPVCAFDLSNAYYRRLTDSGFVSGLRDLCGACWRNRLDCGGALKREDFETRAASAYSALEGLRADEETFGDSMRYNGLRSGADTFLSGLMRCLDCVLTSALETPSAAKDEALARALFAEGLGLLQRQKPDLVGFSVFSQHQLNYALCLAKALKRTMDVQIILGGAALPHLDARALLKLFPWVDFVALGEGEGALAGLLRGAARRDFSQAPGLLYRDVTGIVVNPEAPVPPESLPAPDFSDFDCGLYFSPKPVLSTCLGARPIERVGAELETLAAEGVRHVWLSDEGLSARLLEGLADQNSRRKLGLCWGAMARPTEDFTEGLLRKAREAGCAAMLWGVESFQPRLLELMEKGTTLKDIEGVLEASRRAGLFSEVTLIQGFPTQTPEEAAAEEGYIRAHAELIGRIGTRRFRLEEGTRTAAEPERFGLKGLKRKVLLRTPEGELLSRQLSYEGEGREGAPDLNSLLARAQMDGAHPGRFADSSLFYGLEHTLLHAQAWRRGP
ncbi:MAG TPA: hypothetical protein DCM05_07840 [Elusimicrobia bacterium]|nr:hypothetical protein [Elusimicrobiota bacterium]